MLAPIAAKFKFGLFASKWSNLIASWCCEHYRQYNDAPGRAIEVYYRQWAEQGNQEPDTVRAIEALLVSLSEESERLKRTLSTDHLLDIAALLFEKVQLTDLFDRGRAHLERSEVEKARDLVTKSRKFEIGTGASIDLLTDRVAMESAFAARSETLVQYPGAAGNFFERALGRDQFVAFLGKPKVGKSRFILDVAWRALEQGYKVAYFEMGDLSQAQVLTRFAVRACRRPVKAERYGFPTTMDCSGESPDVKRNYRTPNRDLDADDVARVLEEMQNDSSTGELKLSCHPSGSLSVGGIETIIEGWAQDDWNPDILAFDYLDLADLGKGEDKLEATNDLWMRVRGISQRLHCLCVTATQCNRAGFDVRTLRRDHVGGYMMKLAHVTAMWGLNQTIKEKDLELYRVNTIEGRELEFSESTCLWCAGSLAMGDPIILSSCEKGA